MLSGFLKRRKNNTEMADKNVLKIIGDFEERIEESLRSFDEVTIDLFELRQDEIDCLKERYGERYNLRTGLYFGAPGNDTPHSYVVIRRRE